MLLNSNRFSLNREKIISSKKDFAYLRSNPLVIESYYFTLLVKHSPIDRTKVGFIASKKYSLKAVERNRAKRLLRESYRLLQDRLKAKCFLVFIAKKTMLNKKLDNVKSYLEQVFKNEICFND